MPTKKKSQKQDPKLIALKQPSELEYLCRVWKDRSGKNLKIAVARDVVKKIGRSRRAVNAVLKYLGYHFDPRKKK